MAFKLPDLNYSYDALERSIDARTMEIHHSKHHAGYTNNLNAAIDGTELADKSIEELLTSVSKLPVAVRNNGGGFYNHSLFWKIMGPNGEALQREILLLPLLKVLALLRHLKSNLIKLLQQGSAQAGLGWLSKTVS
jgi:Fe-Mn family superoxide dismutase